MKNGPIKYKKFIVASIGFLAGIVGFAFTQIWFVLGLGFAFSVASLVLD
ncbi:hypothetical protein [Romboutsia sp.]|nr:hypothetical protein [Romboutsia sp.]HSQ87714.1 hypothetical protein [Romboutsia sp.]